MHASDCSAQTQFSEKIDGYFTISSADIFRGVNRNDHDFNAMLGLRYKLSDQWVIGAKLNRSQFPKGPNEFSDDLEFSHFLAWSKALNENFEIQFRFTRYTYPGSDDPFFEYDYNELMVSVLLPQNFFLAYSVSDTSFSFANGTQYAEVGWRKVLPADFEFSASVGGVDAQSQFLPDYAYWDAGVSKAFGKVVADLRYYDSPSEQLWIGREPASKQWALSLTTGW